jgi:hypothetical protein
MRPVTFAPEQCDEPVSLIIVSSSEKLYNDWLTAFDVIVRRATIADRHLNSRHR